MDLASVVGSILAAAAIAGGHLALGGTLSELVQPAALLMVGVGTLGALLLSHRGGDVARAFGRVSSVYFGSSGASVKAHGALVEEVLRVANLARKDGILAVDAQRPSLRSEGLKRGLKFVIDGFEAKTLREMLEVQRLQALEKEERVVRVIEGAASYAPPIGVLASVLGLVKVLGALEDPTRLGQGISAAFMATAYGLALSHLLFQPWAEKLRSRIDDEQIAHDLIQAGVLAVQEQLNPVFLKEKLELRLSAKAES